MPTQSKVSKDVRARIPALHYEFGYDVKKICRLLDIKKSLAYKTLKLHRSHGITAEPRTRQRGRHCKLTTVDQIFILTLLNKQHTVYLDEIQEELLLCCGVNVSIPTLTHTLRHLHFTHKDVSGKALEHNDRYRAIYMNRIAEIMTNPEQLMFGDEASKDERTSNR
ncbi:hypothetical protein PILCRDRAFT_93049 [Piloderma croceum F 1598]|uniref:Winged helix-turn helix domain-containing protein n=1 Tax=Piloderma croceum (strain F 1598) TaxID=765440 RepID=A0A0C3ELL9_PILCF|nr:hypothetical protein PILCRDRAFT_93049 [Piloderma croceum F 1598]